MPSSYENIVLHAVWSTKYRFPQIDARIEEGLHGVMGKIFKDQGCVVYIINGTYDHVHAIFSLPRTRTVASVIQSVKAKSSSWVRHHRGEYEAFGWQDGYGAFSVDYRKKEKIIDYVRRQKEHHDLLDITNPEAKNWNFREELTEILNLYGHAGFPENYVFPDPPDTEGDGNSDDDPST